MSGDAPPRQIADAVAATRRGELIVIPTDTVYGVGTRPDDPSATARVFEAKRRRRSLELPVLVPSIASAREIAMFQEVAERLARASWPGGLTLVLPRRGPSSSWDLGGDPDTIGLRMPSNALACAVLDHTGPLAVTSANLSGEPPATTCDELRASFGDAVSVYLCVEAPLEGPSSTVVDLAHGAPRIVRAGAVAPDAIARSLPRGEALLDSRPSP